MARGNAAQTQVFYKGSTDTQFTIFVESEEMVQKWKNDSTIPLSDVVSGWEVFIPQNGKQGILNTASKLELENEFDTTIEDEVIRKILTSGSVQSHENSERIGTTNDSMGARVAH